MLTGIEAVDGLLGFGELHHRLFEVVQSSFDQHPVLFVKVEQVVPDGLLGQHFGIAHDDDPVARSGQSHVQSAGIVEEANALVFVGSDARHDDEIFLSALESVHTGDFDILQ